MRIDFVDATPKHSKIKKTTIIVLVILFISLFAILGIYYAKLYNLEIISLIKRNMQNNNINNEKIDDGGNKENTQSSLLPQYTQNSRDKMQTIYNLENKIAYLTFDDGPSEVVTNLILDVLKEKNVKATFFVVGSNVNKYPEIVKRAYLEGHYIANHGYSHNYNKIYESVNSVLEEFDKTEKAIQKAIDVTEYSSHLFRFPGGYFDSSYSKIKKQAGKLLNQNNISYIDWNVLTGDAQGANTKEMIIKNVKTYTKNKGNIVVLMHDSSSKILTYEALTDIIKYLKDEGYTFENFYSIMK